MGDLLRRYRDTVTVGKRSGDNERFVINALLRQPFAEKRCDNATAEDFSTYRDVRLAKVKSRTVNQELSLLQHAYELARTEWSLPVEANPLHLVRRPKADPSRNRRLQSGEQARLLAESTRCRNRFMRPLILLAIETGMRRGELLRIEYSHVNWNKSLLDIPITKNGHPRTIPLSPYAVDLLHSLYEGARDDRLIPITGNAVRLSWGRLIRRAGIDDLHFHDLRHEAISRFFEQGLSVPEVALISGHRDPRMLFRFTHLKAEDVARKLVGSGAKECESR